MSRFLLFAVLLLGLPACDAGARPDDAAADSIMGDPADAPIPSADPVPGDPSTVDSAGAPGSTAPPAAGGAARADAAQRVVYVDVRTPEEFRQAHVDGAILIPYDQMEQRWKELEQHRGDRMIVYCRTGRRSGIALDVLRAHGFTTAENGGGLDDLVRAGVKTTTGP